MHKALKILICLVLAFMFVFVQPMQKIKQIEVEAAGPLLVVVEKLLQSTAIKMGVDFISGDAMDKFSRTAAGKFIQDKTGINLAKQIEVEASNGFGGGSTDGGGAGRSVKVKVSPELNAALVDEVADYAENLIQTDVERKTKYIQPFNTKSDLVVEAHDPLHNTGIEVTFTIDPSNYSASAQGLNFAISYLNLHIIPIAFSQSSKIRIEEPSNPSKSSYYQDYLVSGGEKVDVYPQFYSSGMFTYYVYHLALN